MTQQVETATIVGTIGAGGAGNATIVVTALGMGNSPKTISVAVDNNDTAAIVAGKVRSVLALDVDVQAFFLVGGATDKVILTARTAAANDSTMNISSDNGTCSGLTTEATSANTIAGAVTTANGYCTLAQIKTQLPETAYATTTDYDGSITAMILAASRMFDREVGRWDNFFYPLAGDQTRYYDGTIGDELPIEEFVSITSVSVSPQGDVIPGNYLLLAATDYYAAPYNAPLNNRPYRTLIMDYINGAGQAWFPFRKGVKVIGVPGWSLTPPTDITEACIIQVVRWVQRAKALYQDIGADQAVGGILIKGQTGLDNDIKALLYGYKLELG